MIKDILLIILKQRIFHLNLINYQLSLTVARKERQLVDIINFHDR